MFVWRLCKQHPSDAAFDGEGARLYGGRWNQKGTRLVYASATLSLAALEYLVHAEPGQLKLRLFSYAADVPDALIEAMSDTSLPSNWRRVPEPDDTRSLGTSWARALTAAVLSVPSVVIPRERNYLLNPAHADFKNIRVTDAGRFTFDSRLWI